MVAIDGNHRVKNGAVSKKIATGRYPVEYIYIVVGRLMHEAANVVATLVCIYK